MTFVQKFNQLNRILIPLIGEENVEIWWNSPNKAFEDTPPIHFIRTDFNKVKSYLVAQYAGNYS